MRKWPKRNRVVRVTPAGDGLWSTDSHITYDNGWKPHQENHGVYLNQGSAWGAAESVIAYWGGEIDYGPHPQRELAI